MFAFLPGAPRGRHERLKKKATQHSKNTTKTSKNEFSRGPGPSLQKSPPKTAKSHPPGGQHDPQERPRRGRERPKSSQDDPKTTPRAPQERPKSRPKAVSEQPWRPSGADLAPKRLPEPSGEALGPLGVGFWRLRGSLFEASSASCGALLAEPSGEQAQAQDGSAGHAKRLQFA